MCKRGEIYVVDLPESKGSVQKGKRPFLIIQNDKGNKFSTTVIGVVLTSKISKNKIPTHVTISTNTGLLKESLALCEQVFTIDKCTMLNRIGEIDSNTMILVDKAIKISVGVEEQGNNNSVKEIDKKVIDTNIVINTIAMLKNKKGDSKIILQLLESYCKEYGCNYKDFVSLV